jgi:hypothetical protein
VAPNPNPKDPKAKEWDPVSGPFDWEGPLKSAVIGDNENATGEPALILSSITSDDAWIMSTAYFRDLTRTV